MSNLTELQLNILSSALENVAGIAVRPATLKTGPASKVVASLVTRQFGREVMSKGDWPVWRKDGDGKSFSLKILKAGRVAVEQARAEHPGNQPAPDANNPQMPMTAAVIAAIAPRGTTKIGGIVDLLRRNEGATTDEMIAATGWLPHTLRAALTGLRKRGYEVERVRAGNGSSTAYRITSGVVQAAA